MDCQCLPLYDIIPSSCHFCQIFYRKGENNQMRAENAKPHNSQSVKMLHATLNILGEIQKTKNRSRQKNKPSKEESLLSADHSNQTTQYRTKIFLLHFSGQESYSNILSMSCGLSISFASSNSKQQQTPHPNSHHPILNSGILVTQIPLEIY